MVTTRSVREQPARCFGCRRTWFCCSLLLVKEGLHLSLEITSPFTEILVDIIMSFDQHLTEHVPVVSCNHIKSTKASSSFVEHAHHVYIPIILFTSLDCHLLSSLLSQTLEVGSVREQRLPLPSLELVRRRAPARPSLRFVHTANCSRPACFEVFFLNI